MFRISREINPGITNFRDLDQPWFLLGAIGDFSDGEFYFSRRPESRGVINTLLGAIGDYDGEF